jgi:hypothetical protein
MHIWMEADIIRLIVSDARWAVKTTLDLLGRKFWMQRIKKPTVRDAWFPPGGCRTKGYPPVRCHQAREKLRRLDPQFAFSASKIWFGLALPGHVVMAP